MIFPKPLTDEDRTTYEWQMWVPDFGESGQEKLKGASVLVSRFQQASATLPVEPLAGGRGDDAVEVGQD